MEPAQIRFDFVNKGLRPAKRALLAVPSDRNTKQTPLPGPSMPIDLATVASHAGIVATIVGFALLVLSITL
ncbi:MAG: hypothetical protein CL927_10670 [Deltaproteobacteria bacterium]|nr:hypothetical protein [Deltaproteobacteria bacterium]HCH63543.1 hypothetical protein [Deltaproteobacteria bacterium]